MIASFVAEIRNRNSPNLNIICVASTQYKLNTINIFLAELWSTHPLTEMSTRNLPGVKGGRLVCKTELTAVSEPIV
jgi:hypothetical protein